MERSFGKVERKTRLCEKKRNDIQEILDAQLSEVNIEMRGKLMCYRQWGLFVATSADTHSGAQHSAAGMLQSELGTTIWQLLAGLDTVHSLSTIFCVRYSGLLFCYWFFVPCKNFSAAERLLRYEGCK